MKNYFPSNFLSLILAINSPILSLTDMQSLEHRRYYSSLVLLYKCMNSNGPQYIKNFFPQYIKNFFQARYTKYNLRSTPVRELIWNNLATITNYFITHLPIVSRLWNKLPVHIKTSSTFSDFNRTLNAFDLSKLGPSCHCNSCI